MAFIGNTLIFIIAGTIIGFKLPSVQVEDFVQLIVMYLVCTLIRTIVVGFVYIVFRTLGFNIEKKDQIVTIWAGLRGAVGLSLAMMVHANSKIWYVEHRQHLFQELINLFLFYITLAHSTILSPSNENVLFILVNPLEISLCFTLVASYF